MSCDICLHPIRKAKYVTVDLIICQNCITNLCKVSFLPSEVLNRLNVKKVSQGELNFRRAMRIGILSTKDQMQKRPEGIEYENLKFSIRKRDGYKCHLCRRSSENITELHVHHIISLSKFGTNHKENLVTVCYACHNKIHKGTVTKPKDRDRIKDYV